MHKMTTLTEFNFYVNFWLKKDIVKVKELLTENAKIHLIVPNQDVNSRNLDAQKLLGNYIKKSKFTNNIIDYTYCKEFLKVAYQCDYKNCCTTAIHKFTFDNEKISEITLEIIPYKRDFSSGEDLSSDDEK